MLLCTVHDSLPIAITRQSTLVSQPHTHATQLTIDMKVQNPKHASGTFKSLAAGTQTCSWLPRQSLAQPWEAGSMEAGWDICPTKMSDSDSAKLKKQDQSDSAPSRSLAFVTRASNPLFALGQKQDGTVRFQHPLCKRPDCNIHEGTKGTLLKACHHAGKLPYIQLHRALSLQGSILHWKSRTAA